MVKRKVKACRKRWEDAGGVFKVRDDGLELPLQKKKRREWAGRVVALQGFGPPHRSYVCCVSSS